MWGAGTLDYLCGISENLNLFQNKMFIEKKHAISQVDQLNENKQDSPPPPTPPPKKIVLQKQPETEMFPDEIGCLGEAV